MEVDNKVVVEIFLLLDFVLLFLTRSEVSLIVLPTLFTAYLLPSKFGMKTDVFLIFITLFSVPLLRDLRHLIFGGSLTYSLHNIPNSICFSKKRKLAYYFLKHD
jgi:hypothetical protein